MAYHGPTSIFNSIIIEPRTSVTSSVAPSPFNEDVSSLYTPAIRLCIGLFFFWQYPQFMFIDRECFIQEFEQNPTDSEFCSPALIYACCAIGALMSPDPEICATSASYAESSETLLKADNLTMSRITTLQAMLVLAYYHFGRGRLSKGWMLSGNDSSCRGIAPKFGSVTKYPS